ncbi:MAG: hypothetical protein K8L99_20420 [Anaerolineae bacterium]|nr:hypothetical protein [Anaerolineae bacterium]
MDTMQQIQALSTERFDLWRLAGKQQLTTTQKTRIDHITGELAVLWDRHRREDAARRWNRRDDEPRRLEKYFPEAA